MKIKHFLIIFLVIFLFQIIAFPSLSKAEDIGTAFKEGDEWIKEGKVQIEQEKLRKAQSFLFNSLLAVGTALTVVVGGYLGIKFMMASAEEKADIKQTLIPYVVGSVVIFSAFIIWKIVITVLDKM